MRSFGRFRRASASSRPTSSVVAPASASIGPAASAPSLGPAVAKVDSAAVQDGFQLYLHGFIVTDDGHWAVVQQGMNGDLKQARRYHWLSEGMSNFVDAPHAAIEGLGQGEIVNLTDHRAGPSRQRQLELLGSLGPDGIARELGKIMAWETAPAPMSVPATSLQGDCMEI